MECLNIALLQLEPCGVDHEANRAKGLEYCERAKGMNADIALFPEMWNVGYAPFSTTAEKQMSESGRPVSSEVKSQLSSLAIEQDSYFIRSFQSAARELEMAIVITYLERCLDGFRNSASVIDRFGKIVLTYSKVHLCEFSVEAALIAGSGFPVCSLDTTKGRVKVGVMICFDREFPETARILMLNGVEIILTPNACEMESNRLGQFRSRAFENMAGVALANYPGAEYGGNSVAYSPITFSDDESSDTTLVRASSEEGVWMASFDLKAIREYRKRECWGNAFRRPELYGRLVDADVAEPFVRERTRK